LFCIFFEDVDNLCFSAAIAVASLNEAQFGERSAPAIKAQGFVDRGK
jgi:hypothetical protein